MSNPNEASRQLSLIIVADSENPDKGNLLNLLLEKQISFSVAESPDEAENCFADQLPDMVLLLDGPSLDAFSLFEQMRNRWGCRLHGVIVSSTCDQAHLKKALQLGAMDLLSLPVSNEALVETLNRAAREIGTCTETSRQLLEASHYERVFSCLPFGSILIGSGEKILNSNKAAQDILLSTGRTEPATVEELAAALFGPDYYEQLMQIRNAIRSGQAWRETLFLGRKTLALYLMPPATASEPTDSASCQIMTLIDTELASFQGAISPAFTAAAFDLLYAHHLSPKEQGRLEELLTEGVLPAAEQFGLTPLLEDCRQHACQSCVNPVTITLKAEELLPETITGQPLILKECLMALLEWAGRESGNGAVTLSASLHGRQGNQVALRFQVSAVERRLTHSSYRNGDEYIANQIASSGQSAFKQLRGLGLSTLLASRLGSSLIIRSVAREGKTACFDLWCVPAEKTVSAPFKPAAATQSLPIKEDAFLVWDAMAISTEDQSSLRILVAEDNPLEQRSLESVLSRMGHKAVIVSNGREAVEEFEHNEFDLVLLDILMPVMDGFEAVRLIREREQRLDTRTPVLALTSYTLKAVQDRCSRAGMNGYLSKPVTVEKATQVIDLFLTRNETPSVASLSPLNEVDPAVLDYRPLCYDKELYREMVDLFMEHGLPLFNDLEKLLATNDSSDDLHQAAHKLKGMAANIGAPTMRTLMGELQDLTDAGASVDYDRFLRELVKNRQQLVEALHSIDWDSYRQPN